LLLKNYIINIVSNLWWWSVSNSLPFANSSLQLIKSRLRNKPTWINGHKLIAEGSLANRDLETAFITSVALKKLGQTIFSELVLGKILVRRGEFRQAINCLDPLITDKKTNKKYLIEIKEELIAAYIALDQKKQAKEIFDSIPLAKQTSDIVAIAKYLE
jgi:thioredoxin-like negative regulator of GroEL